MNAPSPQPPPIPLSRAKARNAALMNQLATPGLGSWLAGRRLAGAGQLLLAVAGFLMVISWFARLMIEMYQEFNNGAAPHSVARIGEAGALCFAGAWVWSLFTSLSILREGKAKNPAKLQQP